MSPSRVRSDYGGECKVLHYSDPLNFQQTQEQFGITQIHDAIRIQCNFDGLVVIDPITVSENTSLSLSHAMYPTKLQLSTLSGKKNRYL